MGGGVTGGAQVLDIDTSPGKEIRQVMDNAGIVEGHYIDCIGEQVARRFLLLVTRFSFIA